MRLTAREPTVAELAEAMSNKPVYKVVRVVRKGVLKSLWVDGTREHPQWIKVDDEHVKGFALTYHRGQLSTNGKYGIWCCKDLPAARRQVVDNGRSKLCAIFKAFPLGVSIEVPRSWKDPYMVLYPAIILGKQVVEMEDRRAAGNRC